MNVMERMREVRLPAVSAVYFADGEIQWRKAFGEIECGNGIAAHVDSMFHACSISKMVTALCVMRLAQCGVLDLDRDVNEYLKSWKIPSNEYTDKKCVTLKSLLSHQAGFLDHDGSFEPIKGIAPANIDILKGSTPYHIGEVSPKYQPESQFAYSDAGYCVIEQIITDTCGESLYELIDKVVLKPLALRNVFFWESNRTHDATNCVSGHDMHGNVVENKRAHYPNPNGAGLWCTPKDLATIVLDIINSYNDNSGIILDQAHTRLMLKPHGCADFVGLGVFLGNDSAPFFMSQGWGIGMQCKLKAYPSQKRGAVVMTNFEPGKPQDESLTGEILEYILANETLD